MEIAPGVYFVPNETSGPAGGRQSNVFIIGNRVTVAVDSGFGDAESMKPKLDYLKGLGSPQVRYILITHAHSDHAGGAEALRQATGAQVVTHIDEAEGGAIELATEMGGRGNITLKVDRMVQEGEIIEVDGIRLEAIHTPGHTPGSVCYYLREQGIIFTGDHIPGAGTVAIGPPPRGDMTLYMASLHKLLNYDLNLLCPGHGPVVRNPKVKIQELIQHRLEREEQVLAGLRRGNITVEKLFKEIYPEMEQRLTGAAKNQILSHLMKLVQDGRVRSQGGEGEEASYTIV